MMSACPKCRKMAFRSNAVNNSSVVTTYWITFLLVLISLNLVTSRRITATDADIIEFSLGDKLHKSEKVPVYSKVQLKCLYESPIWYKNGIKLNVEMRRMKTITFEKIKKTDAGIYSCKSDTDQSSSLTLSVLPGGEVKSNFAGNVEVYSQVSKRADELHNHNESDYYQKKELDEHGDLNTEENAENSPTDDIRINRNEGSPPTWKDRSSLLRALSKPSGSNIRILCLATGNPTPNITWTKDNKHIVRTMGKTVYRKWDIRMEDTIPEDSGQYKCTVCNIYGCIEHTTKLVILGGEVKANFAGNMEVYSQVLDRADELHYHNESDYYYEREPEENGDLDNEENAENSPTDDVRFEHDEGSPPAWKDQSSLLRTLPKPSGSYIRIPCLATGNPIPNITWTKDNKPIVRSMGKVLYRKWAIRMEDAIPEDSGQYKCIVCNVYGCIEHTTKLIIQDRVNHKPIVLTRPKNLTLTVGQSGDFRCGFLSDLTHVIAWTFSACFDASCPEIKNASLLKADPERSDVLKLENVTHENEGWYTCIAANSLGTSAASAYLHVVDEFYTDVPQSPPSIKNHMFWIIIVTVIAALLFLLGCVFILFISRKLKHEKLMKHRMETVHQWTKKVIIYKPSPDPGNPETMVMPIIKIEKQRTTLLQSSNTNPTQFNEYEFPLDSNWEIPRSQLTMGPTLGEGAFGRVVMAEATGLGKNQGSCIVAVKMVKEDHTDADMASLVREMEVMKMIGKHINVITLLGCCTQEGPLYVIVEYALHGNLKDFLFKNRPLSENEFTDLEEKERKNLAQKDLISFAYQVARGMEFLASRRYIHRDVAARNVLVSENYIMKIADFGLARDIQDTEYYRKNTNGRLPIKWMAPESLQDKFYDTQSDVWSYGVLLWEIMTFGESPYRSIMSAEELYNYLMSGQRMERPPRCSLNIYTLMRQCWNLNAHERPTFTDIVESLDKTLTSIANADEEYLDLDLGVQLQLQIDTPPSSDDEPDTDNRYRYITKNATTIPLLRNGK